MNFVREMENAQIINLPLIRQQDLKQILEIINMQSSNLMLVVLQLADLWLNSNFHQEQLFVMIINQLRHQLQQKVIHCSNRSEQNVEDTDLYIKDLLFSIPKLQQVCLFHSFTLKTPQILVLILNLGGLNIRFQQII